MQITYSAYFGYIQYDITVMSWGSVKMKAKNSIMGYSAVRVAFIVLMICTLVSMLPFMQLFVGDNSGHADAAGYVHTISFMDNHGDQRVSGFSDIRVADNANFTIPNKTPEGYNFEGWELYRDADDKVFLKSGRWANVDDANVTYTIDDIRLYQPGETYTLGPLWTTDGGSTSDFHFAIRGEKKEYTISYNMNGGTGSIGSLPVTYEHFFNISMTVPKRPGYEFKGWTLKRISDGKYYAAYGVGWKTEAEITSNNYMKRLYFGGEEYQLSYSWVQNETTPKGFQFVAQWEPKKYGISYDTKGGSGIFTPLYIEYYSYYNITNTIPVKSGYTFMGWNLTRSADNKIYVMGSGWKTSSEISSGNLTPRLYSPEERLQIGASWIEAAENTAFTFTAVWSHTHSYNNYYTVDKQATCTTPGSKSRHCSVCGAILQSSVTVIPVTNHSYGAWVITKEATCTEAGSKKHSCNNCGYSVSEVIPAGHKWNTSYTIDKAATDTEAGSKSIHCSVCDTVKPGSTVTIEPGSQGQGSSGSASASKGASAAAAEKAIMNATSDEGPAGTEYGQLKLRSKKQTKSSITISWNKVNGAVKYVIYGNKCGTSNRMKKLTAVTGKTRTFKKVAGKKVSKGTYYKFIVVALDKNNKVVSTSKVIHVATKGGKVGNDKSVSVKKTVIKNAVNLKKGKSLSLKAKAVRASSLKVKKHRSVAYESSNRKIATVSSKGVIRAKKKGSCYIYAYAQNGVYKKIKITVR